MTTIQLKNLLLLKPLSLSVVHISRPQYLNNERDHLIDSLMANGCFLPQANRDLYTILQMKSKRPCPKP